MSLWKDNQNQKHVAIFNILPGQTGTPAPQYGPLYLPCLQNGSCPDCRNVCPWSAPGCATRSSSGSSPTPSSSSPPPSAQANQPQFNHSTAGAETGTSTHTRTHLMVFLGMPVLPQVPVLVQLGVQAGGREGCSRAQGQHHNRKHGGLLENSGQRLERGTFSELKRVKSSRKPMSH